MPRRKKNVDGAELITEPEKMELQVLVRSGADFKIHPDQVRQWKNVGGTITQEFLGPILYLAFCCGFNLFQ